LLKFLARNARVQPAEQTQLLDALLAKVRGSPVVFGQGEDERLARVVISIARRADYNADAVGAWVKSMLSEAAFPKKPSVANLVVMQNARHLLTSLWAELSVDERPSAGADFLKTDLRAALKTIL
jgi:hypothetical protein